MDLFTRHTFERVNIKTEILNIAMKLSHRTKFTLFLILSILCLAIFSLNLDKSESREKLHSALDDAIVFNNKDGRYQSLGMLTHSYLHYDVYDSILLHVSANDVDLGIPIPPVQPSREHNHWGGLQYGGHFTWDTRWKTPKKFKVWWERVIDETVFQASGTYDKYKDKKAAPGTTWCESIIVIEKPPPSDPGYLIFHFYPDGHIDTEISHLRDFAPLAPRYNKNISTALSDSNLNCENEIPNPYFGKTRPAAIN